MKPSAQFAFAGAKRLDSRITFDRDSVGWSANAAGILTQSAIDVPRFQHDSQTGRALGLLVNGQRTNLLVRSEFDTISTSAGDDRWYDSTTELDTTVNAAAGPDGTTTACLLAINTTTSTKFLVQRTAESTDGTYVFAVYAKPASTDTNCTLLVAGDSLATNGIRYEFSLTGDGVVGSTVTSGTATGGSAKIRKYVNGWYRCEVAATLTGTTNVSVYIYPGTRGAQTTASQTYVAKASLNLASYHLSDIVTVAATATEVADTVTLTGSNFTGLTSQLEMSVVCAFRGNANGTSVIWQMDDTTANERITLSASSGALTLAVVDGGVTQASLSLGTISTDGDYCVACAWTANDIAACINGGGVLADTTATLPTTTQLRFGSDGTNYLNSTIERLTLYQRRHQNSTLQRLCQ